MLDTYLEVITPEGVALQLPAAGPVPRALAWAIDMVARLGVLMMLGMLLSLLGRMGQGIYLILLFLLFWAYPIVLEAAWNGQTLGKRALGLRVVASDGAPLGWLPAITRNLLRTVDMLPFGYMVGLLASLADPHARRLGDMAAGTLVIHVGKQYLPQPAPIESVMAPPLPLQPDEQAAVIAFGERAPFLAPARQVELADIAGRLSGATGPSGVVRLYAISNWLLGRR
ncbi:RDD family protein [Pseudoxanthomonas dokdonensis]|uniref:Membrane protein n=1 Tax=Pseudoxanthomonas dokdonensis TaxID=344882 RepID=A0A0R0CTW8_9GAMM|nr:membrane protein [Pseudoxanthomonas dokdonensis]